MSTSLTIDGREPAQILRQNEVDFNLDSLKLKQINISQASIHSADVEAVEAQDDKHYDDISELMSTLKNALPGINAPSPKYDRVLMLSIYWENGDPEHIPKASRDLEDAMRLLSFDVADPFVIPNNKK